MLFQKHPCVYKWPAPYVLPTMEENQNTPPADDVVLDIICLLFQPTGTPDSLQLLSTADITERVADHLGGEVDPHAVYMVMSNEGFSTMSAGGNLYWQVWPR